MADGPKKMLWGKEHIDNIGYHDYEEILSDAQAMYDWINGKFANYILVFQPRIKLVYLSVFIFLNLPIYPFKICPFSGSL